MVSDGQLGPQMVEERNFVAYLKLSVILNLFQKLKKTVKDNTKKKKMTNKKCLMNIYSHGYMGGHNQTYREVYTQKCIGRSFKTDKGSAINLAPKYNVLCQSPLFLADL